MLLYTSLIYLVVASQRIRYNSYSLGIRQIML